MVLCLLCAAVVIILLIAKIYTLKKSAREISEQFADRLKNDTNNPVYVTSSDKDIKHLADSINTQLSILRKEQLSYINGNNELKNSITNISHDLRTPLTTIRGYLDIAKKTDDTQKLHRYMDIISERTEAMQKLTEELFCYSMIVSKDEAPELEDVYINQLLAESISSFYPVLTQNSITPSIDITDEKIIRRVNKESMSRVFSNILNNAVKYSKGDLDIRLDDAGVITFSNTADEITAVQAEQLFDRFYTVETARGSTGLGLHIARYLLSEMGGSITALYENGKLTFTITI
ncbi:hypothetical protein SAMN02910265_02724 [Ruminococcus flavefaciens]|uniref:histidine kinase n=1 Tax=Ruminococcus flavefaciens TaxID=1265 RepID=A0A1H6KU47_RUMFL|nr:HAMP domain-containing sensor histidine kinase [Ruminococcus flavefaciens]SEH79236.1 hypothetical protein SAMN02910265_02724 [Ruminococcus flavefaciens]